MLFKFIAEAQIDAKSLFYLMVIDQVAFTIIEKGPETRDGVVYAIETELPGEAIWEYMSKVEGSHIMMRTLQTAANFTGSPDPDFDFKYMAANS